MDKNLRQIFEGILNVDSDENQWSGQFRRCITAVSVIDSRFRIRWFLRQQGKVLCEEFSQETHKLKGRSSFWVSSDSTPTRQYRISGGEAVLGGVRAEREVREEPSVLYGSFPLFSTSQGHVLSRDRAPLTPPAAQPLRPHRPYTPTYYQDIFLA
ncbi:hypothetical protein EVAR_51665_1 [Eumeta japonica]|uniref:Uncharacterized protein n=1 Tax=Eumeta variegata TaxID=151549 RepID=A0A4C1YIV0_EUMVA|nr:hypothetical protein EVAR_51665_1 [Eumeta japonica]